MFHHIANQFLNQRALMIKGIPYRILEIEMYLHSQDHLDEYTHQHPDQQYSGTFYFHRASVKPVAKYRGGTFKGMDIVLGSHSVYFGVLIRALRDPNHHDIIGPCNVVDHILSQYGVQSISELTGETRLNVSNNIHDLVLITINEPSVIYESTRIGLKGNGLYSQALYRFTYDPSAKIKEKSRFRKV